MPEFAELITDLICSNCGSKLISPTGIIKFQWGGLPNIYKIGDTVRWWQNEKGTIVEPFTIIEHKKQIRWNCGDPNLHNVIVFDTDPHVSEYVCSNCGKKFEAVAAKIMDTVIVEGVAYGIGEVKALMGFDVGYADIVVVDQMGKYIPRPDWNDSPLSSST